MRVAFAARLRARIASRLARAGHRHRRLGRVPCETCTPGVEARSGIAGPARVQHPKRVARGRLERATGPRDMSERARCAFVGADRHSHHADCVERLHVVRVQRQRCEQRLFGILVLAAHCRHTALHEQGSGPQPVTDAAAMPALKNEMDVRHARDTAVRPARSSPPDPGRVALRPYQPRRPEETGFPASA